MSFLLSAKQEHDLLAWRGASGFVTTFREELLEKLSGCGNEQALETLEQLQQSLDALNRENTSCMDSGLRVIGSLPELREFQQLRSRTAEFYAGLYRHVAKFHSPQAYYEQSDLFLRAVADTVIRLSREKLGLLERHLPEYALIALGPAGRQEFSPFCPVQVLLVSRQDKGIEQESLRQLGSQIYDGFEACGFRVDSAVSPQHYDWCCGMNIWERRLEDLQLADQSMFIDFLRLADQTFLAGSRALASEFMHLTKSSLAECRNALENQVSRVSLLSNGLGILGRLKLEKNGPYRGCFPLLDHALQPLNATILAFAILSSLSGKTSPERIRELLGRGEVSVDMAEQVLDAWYSINLLRLLHEQASQADWKNTAPLHINIEHLSHDDQSSLRGSLEAIGLFQQYLYSTYRALGR